MSAPRRASRPRRYGRDGAVAPLGARTSEPRTLAQYRREVVALLMVGPARVSGQKAMGLVKKWNLYLQAKWRLGRPPCNVADHLRKFERVQRRGHRGYRTEGDPRRPGPKRRLTMTRGTFMRQMRRVRSARTRRGYSRDADAPRAGEVYETRAGNRWEVVSVTDKLVSVKRAGHRTEGPYAWGRTSLRGMREVRKPLLGSLFGSSSPAKAEPEQLSIFSRGLGHERDPGHKRGTKKTAKKVARKTATATKKRTLTRKGRRSASPRASAKASGAHCSGEAVHARRARDKPPPHTCPRATQVQSLVFERWCWPLPRARAWAERHGYRTGKVDVTARFYRFRQLDPKRYKIVGSVPFMRGLNAVMGCPKRG